MPDLIKFGFSGGVFSPKLEMRSDLKKYDLGLRFGRNFFVEYTGGASTRPGTEFLDYIQDDDEPARIVEFAFNKTIANTYAIIFSKSRIRFMQDGLYVLEANKVITSATSTTITRAAHGYLNEDWIKIEGQTYEVANVTANTFTLTTPHGTAVNTTGFAGKTMARIYTLVSPYATADLPELNFSQYRDELYITSIKYPAKKLVRSAATSWALTDVVSDTNGHVPRNTTLAPSSVGTTGVVFAVTAVDVEGRESYIGPTGMILTRLSVNYTTTAGHMVVSWTKPTTGEISHYNVYRSLLVNGTDVHYGMELGYVGKTFFTTFTDNNIIPDFSRTPPIMDLPIIGGQIFTVDVVAGGSGYTDATVLGTTSGGQALSARPIVVGGAIVGVRVLNPGFDYWLDPTVFTATIGTGAVLHATPTPQSSYSYATSAMVQQRRVYAGSTDYPGTLFGSRIGDPDNFYSSGLNLATDPYALSLDSEQLTPIRHIMPYPDGLFVFQDTGVIQVRGIDDGVIKVGSTKAQELTEDGCAQLRPLKIKREFLYLNSAKSTVYSLGPTNLPQYYVPTDISLYSEHYFRQDNPIVSWTWAKSPHKLVWAVRADGTYLSMAYVSEQEVNAWTDHSTQGAVEDVESISENEIDRCYMITRRVIGGQSRRYIERMALREPKTLDDMWAVDCGLRTNLTYPNAAITLTDNDSFGVAGNPGDVVKYVVASSSIFSVNDVGKIIRVNEARGTVVFFQSSTTVFVSFDRYFSPTTDISNLDEKLWPSGSWSMNGVISSVSGLQHLEGKTVEVLGDGRVLAERTVFNGQILLSEDVSYVVVGLGYGGKLQPLPMTVSDTPIEGRYKAPKSLAVRLYNSATLNFGDEVGDILYPLQRRQGEEDLQDSAFFEGMYEVSIAASMTLDGLITVEKSGPVHATVLGYVAETEIGD